MKVLMLGWEFPPHISGGLGTACRGLTSGLAHHGVEVLFVVPKAYGDEPTDSVRVLGCNHVVGRRPRPQTRSTGAAASAEQAEEMTMEEGASPPAPVGRQARTPEAAGARQAPRPGIAPRAADAGEDTADPQAEELLRILAVDSDLRPYDTAATYAERQRVAAAGADASTDIAAEDADAVQPRPGQVRVDPATRAALANLRTLLRARSHSEVLPPPAQVLDEHRFEFTGRYGKNLLEEVARYALAVGEVARREDFDVIHAHDWMTFPAGLVAARVSGKPLVCHVHASEYDRSGENVNPEIRALEQLGVDVAQRIVAVSHYTASILRKRYGADPGRIRVVHNAVTHKEQEESFHWRKAIHEPIVLFLGRVTFQKGPDYFLEAAARVVQVEPRVKFVMSGSGDMLPGMIERTARLGLARHVHFTGFLRGKEVERMYAMADLYVMPSVSEPFGISPLEAMALDVPVIVSRQSGVSEVLSHALKVDFWDVQDLANKMLAVLRYPSLRRQLSELGRDEVRQLRWEVSGRAVKDVYREVVA